MSRHEAGYFEVFERGAGQAETREATAQCVHCHAHFPLRPGSGKTRGFCMNCNGFICGKRCEQCRPFWRWIDEVEGRVNPTAVSVGGNLWLP